MVKLINLKGAPARDERTGERVEREKKNTKREK